jgi:hypothetical protein
LKRQAAEYQSKRYISNEDRQVTEATEYEFFANLVRCVPKQNIHYDKSHLIFSAIQIVALLLSFLVLAFALVGSHGRLYFSNAGGTVAFVMIVVLSVPLLYLFTQRRKLQNKKLLFTIATLIFGLAMAIIFVGIPNMSKQFIIDETNINKVLIYKDNNLAVKFYIATGNV